MAAMVRIINKRKNVPFVKVPLMRGRALTWIKIPKGSHEQVLESMIKDKDGRPLQEIIDLQETNKWIRVVRTKGSGKLTLGHYRRSAAKGALPVSLPSLSVPSLSKNDVVLEQEGDKDPLEVAMEEAKEAAKEVLSADAEIEEMMAEITGDDTKEEIHLFDKEALGDLSYRELGVLCSDRELKAKRSVKGRITQLLDWQKKQK